MIEGFQLQFTSAELVEHLEQKMHEHAGKANAYADQLGKLAELEDAQPHSNDATGSLRSSRESHARRAAYFAIAAKHVIPEETYLLSESDLARLELFDRWG